MPPTDDGPPIHAVSALLMLDGPTKGDGSVRPILDALAEHTLLRPTHGSTDDRTRTPFDAESLAADAERLGSMVWLSRTRHPKYVGGVEATNQLIVRMFVDHERIRESDIEPVCRELQALIDRLEPVYAAVHLLWPIAADEHTRSVSGLSAHALDYRKAGPPGLFAWTWFGPDLVERFTVPVLEAAGATSTTWGGAHLALADEPWTLGFDELRRRQVAANDLLRPSGLLGDHDVVPTPGPNWVAIPNVTAT